MYAYRKTADYDYPKAVPTAEGPDEFLSDDDFYDALVDAINQNFVLEVEASLARDD